MTGQWLVDCDSISGTDIGNFILAKPFFSGRILYGKQNGRYANLPREEE
jgi:hypothetical protein